MRFGAELPQPSPRLRRIASATVAACFPESTHVWNSAEGTDPVEAAAAISLTGLLGLVTSRSWYCQNRSCSAAHSEAAAASFESRAQEREVAVLDRDHPGADVLVLEAGQHDRGRRCGRSSQPKSSYATIRTGASELPSEPPAGRRAAVRCEWPPVRCRVAAHALMAASPMTDQEASQRLYHILRVLKAIELQMEYRRLTRLENRAQLRGARPGARAPAATTPTTGSTASRVTRGRGHLDDTLALPPSIVFAVTVDFARYGVLHGHRALLVAWFEHRHVRLTNYDGLHSHAQARQRRSSASVSSVPVLRALPESILQKAPMISV